MPNRPHSRQKHTSSGQAHVSRKGRTSSGGPSSGGAGGLTRGIGGGGLILALVIYFLFGGKLGSGPTSSYANQPFTSTATTSQTYTDATTSSVSTDVSSKARDKYTTVKGAGKDTYTLMIYMCGSNLESQSGMGTSDLREIVNAKVSNDNLNIIVETGGAKKWKTSGISASKLQRWEVTSRGLSLIDEQKSASMTDKSTLSSFISYTAKKYPANRYGLIMWDHGGGSVSGYGHDENYSSSGTMTLSQMASALKTGGIKYDFIGFDACLMATMETAVALEPYADYLIASEEVEPGTGWYYTNWVGDLDDNTSLSTLDMGKTLIDDYASHAGTSCTLSLTDLSELSGTLPSALNAFGKAVSSSLEDDYTTIAKARTNAKEFSPSMNLDQIDLVDFCDKLDTKTSNSLATTIKSAVKYNKASSIRNAYGLSVYFPKSSTTKMSTMSSIYDAIDMDDAYAECVRGFAVMQGSGQLANSSTYSSSSLSQMLQGSSGSSSSSYGSASSLFEMLSGMTSGSSYGTTTTSGSVIDASSFSQLFGGSSSSWITQSMLSSAANMLSNRATIDDGSLETTTSGSQTLVTLTDEQWDTITDCELNLLIDDGKGYIDMGLDNVAEYTDEGDLIMDWDGTWLTLNGQPVTLYPVSDIDEDGDGKYITTKYIPANVNGTRMNIIVEFNEETGEDSVLGASEVYDSGVEGKGLYEFQSGDTIQLLCDYYTYDGTLKASYKLGDAITVSDDGLSITNMELTTDEGDFCFTYKLTDIDQAAHYTAIQK